MHIHISVPRSPRARTSREVSGQQKLIPTGGSAFTRIVYTCNFGSAGPSKVEPRGVRWTLSDDGLADTNCASRCSPARVPSTARVQAATHRSFKLWTHVEDGASDSIVAEEFMSKLEVQQMEGLMLAHQAQEGLVLLKKNDNVKKHLKPGPAPEASADTRRPHVV